MVSKKITSQHPLENGSNKLLSLKKIRRKMLYGLAAILMAVIVVGLLPVPSMGYIDNDYPHNNLYDLSCNAGTCHSYGRDYRLPVYPSTDEDGSQGCLWCHDGIPKPTTDPENPNNTILLNNPTGPVVVSHSSTTTSDKYGTWAMDVLTAMTACINNNTLHGDRLVISIREFPPQQATIMLPAFTSTRP